VTALSRAALAGAATGGRGFTGLAALALATPSGPATQPDRTLSVGWVQGVAALLAVGEIVADKLPQAPSRLEPAGLGLRCLSAAAAGLIIARRAPETADPGLASSYPGETSGYPGEEAETGRPPVPGAARTVACVTVAAAAAVGASWLGVKWRGWAAARTGHDYVGAGLEDALAVCLAGLSVRR
jgi:uncharacterized membrane protein